MAKEVAFVVKLQIKGGVANPSPPVGPALGARGVNSQDFCKQFNARTQDRVGELLPVVINIYKDKSFDFVVKSPPVPSLILAKTSNVKKGSPEPNRKKIATIKAQDVKEIAATKMSDLNAFTSKAAESMIRGTARSMGINVE